MPKFIPYDPNQSQMAISTRTAHNQALQMTDFLLHSKSSGEPGR